MSVEVRALGFESMVIWVTLPPVVAAVGVGAVVVGAGGIGIAAAGGSEWEKEIEDTRRRRDGRMRIEYWFDRQSGSSQ
jgi:hypothetical protein